MLPRGTIEVEELWKRFRPDRKRMLLRDELERVKNKVVGKTPQGYRWALRDVNLSAQPGESVGLVGSNGSGKSTLLKILTRVMYPYSGSVQVKGRVGALIEVRAGIHPDLSGRENVYLYGSLLGLKRKEVAKRFDDIVSFAQLDDAIDRQVKFYSSGMQMRLGFGVAAFLEPDVLLVDEVLAVGDAAFQQRCLERMRQVLAQGTTIVFVSHDLASVEATCSRGIWLNQGRIEADGPVTETLSRYRSSIEAGAETSESVDGLVNVTNVKVSGGSSSAGLETQAPATIELGLRTDAFRGAFLHLGVTEGTATPIFVLRRDLQLHEGDNRATCHVPRLPLPRGRYYLWIGVTDVWGGDLLAWHPIAHFDVWGPDLDAAPRAVVRLAPIHVEAEWDAAAAG